MTDLSKMTAAVSWPHSSLADSHQDGCTEGWVAEAACALLKARGGRPAVLETGSFQGTTSAWLALTLQQMGGGDFTACEIDPVRADVVRGRLAGLGDAISDAVTWRVANVDVMRYIHDAKPQTFDFAFVDDDHEEYHVRREVNALWEKMRRGGIIALHDVFGSCDLQKVVKFYGGYSLNFPRLGPAGGLGLIQIPE